jgi:hypothetical protein
LDLDLELDVDMHMAITGQRADRTIDLPGLQMNGSNLSADDEVLACALHFEQRLQQQLGGGGHEQQAARIPSNGNKVVLATADNGLAVKAMAHGMEVGTIKGVLGLWKREEAERRRLLKDAQAASAMQQAGWSSTAEGREPAQQQASATDTTAANTST